MKSYFLLCSISAWVILFTSFSAKSDPLHRELREIIKINGMKGRPEPLLPIPGIHSPEAQLGKKLFFSSDLSGDLKVSCATCHDPRLGGGDRLPLPIGTGAVDSSVIGPGREHRTGRVLVPRNAPTTFNVAMWRQVLFFDGRVERIQLKEKGKIREGIRTPDVPPGSIDPEAGDELVAAQARFPVVAADEMRGRHLSGPDSEQVRRGIAERLSTSPEWKAQFQKVFGKSQITFSDIARALSSYQRSQVFIDSPWSRYVKGDDQAVTGEVKRGARLFYAPIAEGGAGCATCHGGDFFTDERFHIIAVPQVGPGRYDQGLGLEDHGRYIEEPSEAHRYAFRTPSLLNVEVTGPYGHSGSLASLEDIVRHHLNPTESIARYAPDRLPPSVQVSLWRVNTMKALAALQWARTTKETTLFDVAFTDSQVADIISFLKSLTDPCVKDSGCLAPWVE